MAANETLKNLIQAKLPHRPCPPEVLALLEELSRHARAYHDNVTIPFRRLPAEKQRVVREDSRFVQADKNVKDVMARLRERKVNLFGFSAMDFCEAYLEVYRTFSASR